MTRFSDRVVFITGAARGQGRSHAVRFAEEGADLVLLDICGPVDAHVPYPPATPEDLAETAALAGKYGRQVLARQADVRDHDRLQAVADEALAALGRIDVVVANAGICSFEWGWQIPESAWRATLDTNLTGVWNTVRATVPAMIDAGRGGCVVITSAAAEVRDQPLVAHYAASTVGQVGLMKVLATELARYGIRVNTVNPLGVNTVMATGAPIAMLQPAVGDPPHGPWAEPDDVSDVVLYLASDEARSVTGVQMPVQVRG